MQVIDVHLKVIPLNLGSECFISDFHSISISTMSMLFMSSSFSSYLHYLKGFCQQVFHKLTSLRISIRSRLRNPINNFRSFVIHPSMVDTVFGSHILMIEHDHAQNTLSPNCVLMYSQQPLQIIHSYPYSSM